MKKKEDKEFVLKNSELFEAIQKQQEIIQAQQETIFELKGRKKIVVNIFDKINLKLKLRRAYYYIKNRKRIKVLRKKLKNSYGDNKELLNLALAMSCSGNKKLTLDDLETISLSPLGKEESNG